MMPNAAWLDFIKATGAADNPGARSLFLAGFQAGLHFAERGLYAANQQAVEEIQRTINAIEDAKYGKAHRA